MGIVMIVIIPCIMRPKHGCAMYKGAHHTAQCGSRATAYVSCEGNASLRKWLQKVIDFEKEAEPSP